MVATVVGGVPLVISTGAGAEARQALGWIVVGGLGLATFITLFVTPIAFLLLARFGAARSTEADRLHSELADAVQTAGISAAGPPGRYSVAAE
jgi:HAE1 family hydrophobic/amphiphilic exporter-1